MPAITVKNIPDPIYENLKFAARAHHRSINSEITEQAELLLKKQPHWIAPVLWVSELRNVLTRYLRNNMLEFDDIPPILQETESLLSDQEYKISSLSVMNLVSKSDCSAYDCEFVALAKNTNTLLVTQDKKIIRNFPEIAFSLESYLELKA